MSLKCFRKKILPIASLGIGIVIGAKYGKHWEWLNSSSKLSLPTVAAATSTTNKPSLTDTAVAIAITPGKRSAEIMKYGYPGSDVRSFDNMVLSYDRRNKNAHWVFEHISPDLLNIKDTDRNKSTFLEDSSIHHFFRSTNDDYKGSGYDRGHLAAARNHRHSQRALDQTFFLTNVAPQVGSGFNRGVWNDLEKYIRAKVRRNRNVYVCTGPLYLPRKESDGKLYVKYEVIGKNHVAVPTHFFKVALIEDNNGDFELLSFVLPNQAMPDNTPLKNFMVPVDSIERAAGILLFNLLPKAKLKSINGKKL